MQIATADLQAGYLALAFFASMPLVFWLSLRACRHAKATGRFPIWAKLIAGIFLLLVMRSCYEFIADGMRYNPGQGTEFPL